MKDRDPATLALAVVGAVLGIINTFQTVTRDQIRVRVSPRVAFPLADREYDAHLAIEVVNLSSFSLTIAQLGVERKGPPNELRLGPPLMLDGIALPRRMDARSSFTAFFPITADFGFLVDAVAVYAKTDAGKKFRSRGRHARRMLRSVISFLPDIDESAHGD